MSNPSESKWKCYDELNEAEKIEYDASMCRGKSRRCNYCSNTYIWNEKLPPNMIEDMAINVELMNRKLVCSWMCYFKLVGRFVRKAPRKVARRSLIFTGYYCGSLDNPYFRKAIGNYAETKEDQEHYQ